MSELTLDAEGLYLELLRGVQALRKRTARDLGPEAGPKIVGAAAQQQIEAAALVLGDGLRPGRRAIRCHPAAMRVVAVFAASAGRDHAVQRDVCEDPDLSHFQFPGSYPSCGFVGPFPSTDERYGFGQQAQQICFRARHAALWTNAAQVEQAPLRQRPVTASPAGAAPWARRRGASSGPTAERLALPDF